MRTLVKLTWVEIKLFIREPITVVFTLALPIIFLFVMGGVFGNTPNEKVYRGVGAMNYYMPAYFALVMMAIGTVALPVHLAGNRERGVLRRFRASSFSVWAVLGSQLMVSFVIAIIGSLLILAFGMMIYHPHLPVSPLLLIGGLRARHVMFCFVRVFPGGRAPVNPLRPGGGAIALLYHDDTGRGRAAAGSIDRGDESYREISRRCAM